MMEHWHTLSAAQVLAALESHGAGLSTTQVAERLQRYGRNELREKKKTPPILVFLKQFLSPLIYVLLAAAVISIIVEHYLDGAAT